MLPELELNGLEEEVKIFRGGNILELSRGNYENNPLFVWVLIHAHCFSDFLFASLVHTLLNQRGNIS